MKLTAVVAASDNDVIGSNNALPWHLPADLAHFKRITMGKPVLMGRRTYESIGKPLPGRLNLVLSRRSVDWPGVERVATLEEARARAAPADEIMVIGGAEVFILAMTQLDVIQLTRVHCTVDGDTFMPPLQPERWNEVSREYRAADERNVYAMTFIELRRITPAIAP
ncbi:MAG: dihydrofolate reductase [Pseudomonadota bacterium]